MGARDDGKLMKMVIGRHVLQFWVKKGVVLLSLQHFACRKGRRYWMGRDDFLNSHYIHMYRHLELGTSLSITFLRLNHPGRGKYIPYPVAYKISQLRFRTCLVPKVSSSGYFVVPETRVGCL